MSICRYCGAEIPDTAQYCGKCGAEQSGGQAMPDIPKPQKVKKIKLKRDIVRLILTPIILIVITIIIIIWNNYIYGDNSLELFAHSVFAIVFILTFIGVLGWNIVSLVLTIKKSKKQPIAKSLSVIALIISCVAVIPYSMLSVAVIDYACYISQYTDNALQKLVEEGNYQELFERCTYYDAKDFIPYTMYLPESKYDDYYEAVMELNDNYTYAYFYGDYIQTLLSVLPESYLITKTIDFTDMFSDIASRAFCHISSDGSYMTIDTNPYDIDNDIYSGSLSAIQQVNTKLGFSSTLYDEMCSTTIFDGTQKDENENIKVSWSFHPRKGLVVTYEKK